MQNELSDAVRRSHEIIHHIYPKHFAIDATCGNGHDTLFLTQEFNDAFGFDIQPLAIRRCEKRLIGIENVSLFLDNYCNICRYVTQPIDCLVYNLGFLPGSDHKVSTKGEETVRSLSLLLPLLSTSGVCLLVCYPRHDSGKELQILLRYLPSSPYHYNIETLNHEILIVIKKA